MENYISAVPCPGDTFPIVHEGTTDRHHFLRNWKRSGNWCRGLSFVVGLLLALCGSEKELTLPRAQHCLGYLVMKPVGRELFSLSNQETKTLQWGQFVFNSLVTVLLLSQQFLRKYSSCEKPEKHLTLPPPSPAQLEFSTFFPPKKKH